MARRPRTEKDTEKEATDSATDSFAMAVPEGVDASARWATVHSLLVQMKTKNGTIKEVSEELDKEEEESEIVCWANTEVRLMAALGEALSVAMKSATVRLQSNHSTPLDLSTKVQSLAITDGEVQAVIRVRLA